MHEDKADISNGEVSDNNLPSWNLDDLYEGMDSPELLRDWERLAAVCSSFRKTYQGRIGSLDAAGLLGCIREHERIETTAGRIASFAKLLYYQNTTDPKLGKFANDCKERIVEMTSPLVFLTIEINEIEDGRMTALLAASPELARFEHFLKRIRKMRPHQLSLEMEKLLSDLSVVGASAWNRLFDETVAGMKFEIDGEQLSLAQTLDRISDHDRSVREKSAKAAANGFGSKLPMFSLITNTLAKEKEIEDKWRRFQSPQASRHLANDIEPDVVASLRDAVVAAYPKTSHRYYRLKARWLELDQLEIWDRNAPLPMESDRKLGWSEAKSMILASFSGFSPCVAKIAERFFANNWIDAGIKPGKATGAFSHPTVADAHPYILLNYLGKPRDVMDLAHELGHGVHQTLAASQGELLSRTPLTLAETASVFGEMLTFRKLLGEAQSDNERRTLLANKVEDMINTVVRQIAFYDFECRLHEQRKAGEITAERINSIWMDVQTESLGPAFRFMDGYETFWAYIPHFIHEPFYVYAYAFGNGLVHALYAEFESGHEDFEDKYIALLKSGGSKNYRDVLAPFGLDVSDPTFWDKGLSVIARFIDDLEAIET